MWVMLFNNPDESPGSFVEATDRIKDLSFTTQAQGGFGSCSFTAVVSGWNAVRWYRSFLSHHLVIVDRFGVKVYEGRIEDTDLSSDGVVVSAMGYYVHGGDLTDGLIYPISTPKSISDMVLDAVALSNWRQDFSHILPTTVDITPQDFTGEQKLRDAIEAVVKYGSDDVIPKPVYFAIWEDQTAHLYTEPALTDEPDWQVYIRDLADGSNLALSRSRKDVYNRIQALYDDPDIGTTFTDWADNLDSQKLFGVREGTINIGAALEGIAITLRDLALNAYSFPTQSSKFGITGRVYTKAGAPVMPYMVRAGQLIRVNDYDPSVAQLVTGGAGSDAAVTFITETTYNAEDNSLELTFGKNTASMDLFLTRLGLSGGVR